MTHPVSLCTAPPAPARTQHTSYPAWHASTLRAASRSLLLLRLAHERAHLLALLLCAQVCAELRVHAHRVSSLTFIEESSPPHCLPPLQLFWYVRRMQHSRGYVQALAHTSHKGSGKVGAW